MPPGGVEGQVRLQVDAAVYFTFGAARFGYAGLHGNVAYINRKPVVGPRLSL